MSVRDKRRRVDDLTRDDIRLLTAQAVGAHKTGAYHEIEIVAQSLLSIAREHGANPSVEPKRAPPLDAAHGIVLAYERRRYDRMAAFARGYRDTARQEGHA